MDGARLKRLYHDALEGNETALSELVRALCRRGSRRELWNLHNDLLALGELEPHLSTIEVDKAILDTGEDDPDALKALQMHLGELRSLLSPPRSEEREKRWRKHRRVQMPSSLRKSTLSNRLLRLRIEELLIGTGEDDSLFLVETLRAAYFLGKEEVIYKVLERLGELPPSIHWITAEFTKRRSE